jgi:hypothetical protein
MVCRPSTLVRRRSLMSLRPQPITPVLDDTTRVARAAFPKGNP